MPAALASLFAKQVVALVGDADPVDRAQDDRLAGAEDHDAPAAERQFVEPLDWVVRHRGTERRCRVDVERRDLDGGGRCRLGRLGRANGGSGGEEKHKKKRQSFHRSGVPSGLSMPIVIVMDQCWNRNSG